MEWEYYTLRIKATGFWGAKIETDKLDATLNEAGSQGWELVSAAGLNQSYGATKELVLFFKRPR
jgi:hypothetical protein